MPVKVPPEATNLSRSGLPAPVVTQLINKVFLDGQALQSQKSRLRRTRRMPREDRHRSRQTLQRALDNVRPTLKFAPPRRRRHLPGARRGEARSRTTLAMRWLIASPAAPSEKTMTERS